MDKLNLIPAPCKDKKLIEVCSEYVETLPSCEFFKDRHRPPKDKSLEAAKILRGRFNCVDLFGLKEELLKTNCFTFRPISWCMFPALQRGDIAKVEHIAAKDIKAGDIPVYRKDGRLFAHRAIGKKMIGGKAHIITRPDMANDKNASETEETVPEEDILGKIVNVRRHKKIFSTNRKKATIFEWVVYIGSILSAKARAFLTSSPISCMAAIQFSRPYMCVAKKIVGLFEKEISFSIVMPSRSGLGIYEYRSFEDIDMSRLNECWNFHVLLKLKKQPVGYITFLNRPRGCPHKGVWWSGGYIRLRYRGTGLGKILLSRSEEFLKHSGVPHIYHPKVRTDI